MINNCRIWVKNISIPNLAQIKFCILIVCLLFTFDVSAATYYVDDANGNDTASGAISAPWQTITKAKSAVNPGDTVVIRSGNYGAVSFLNTDKCGTSWTNAITYKAESGATPVFTSLVFSWAGTGATLPRYIEFDGITITSGVFVTPVTLKDVSYLKLTNLKVQGYYISPNTAGLSPYGIFVKTTIPTHYNNNIFIDGCEITDAGQGISVAGNVGDNVEITHNHIHHIAGSGIAIGATSGNGNILINGNHIHNQAPVVEGTGTTHGTGISIRSSNLTVKNNIIHDYGNTRGIRTYQDVFPDVGYCNMLFENNLVYDARNVTAVEFVDVGSNFIVRNNTLIGQHYRDSDVGPYYYSRALGYSSATGVDVNSNYLQNNILVGIVGNQYNTSFAEANIKNNIMYTYEIGNFIFRASLEGNIVIMGQTGTSNYFEPDNGFFVFGTGFTYARHGLDLTDDFKLAPGSPAIGYANPAYAPATDILGNTRDSAPDAGCYEYGAAASAQQTNQPPIFDSIGDKTAVTGQLLTFTVNASDPDGDSLTYSAARLPTSATFSNKTFNWTPQPAQIGTYTVSFTVSDGSLQNSLIVPITVTPADTDADGLPDNWEMQYFGNLDKTAQDDPDADGTTNLDEYNNGTDPTIYNPPKELVLYMKFDEAAGVVAKDSSEYSNDANLINNPVWTAGKFGTALGFNDVNSYVHCANDPSLNLTGSLTICAWINPRSFGQNGWGRIVDKGDGAATGYSFFVDQASSALAYVIYGGTLIKSDPNSIKLNQWQHAAVVYDQTLNTVTFYINGVKTGTVNYTTPPLDSANKPLVIGIRNSDLKRAFDGLIDDVRVYDQALDQTAIQKILTEPQSGLNHPPVLDPIGNQTVSEGQNLDITINATDSEDDPITYSALNLPAGAVFNPADRTFSWIPDYNQAGSYNVTFTASDSFDLGSETINIIVNNINRAPVLDELADKTVNENTPVTFSVSAVDPDSDQISYWVQNLPDTATFLNQIFAWTPSHIQAGTHLISFGASDGQLEDVDTVIITVNNVNMAPVLQTIGNKSVNENSTIAFTISASDAEKDPITYSARNLPAGASFQAGTFSWTPTYTQAGNYNVTFVAADAQLEDTETINITVNNTNRAPVLDKIANRTVDEGTSLTFAVNATDPDGDQLTYWTRYLPGNATFVDHIFEWTPFYFHAGTHLIIFGVTDGITSVSQSVIITVNNVNTAPVLQTIGNKSVNANSTITFTIIASDTEKDPITYSARNLPAGASFQSGTFSWTPTDAQIGTYNVTFVASDAQLEDTETINITVNKANLAPVLDKIVNRTVDEGTSLTFAVNATDPDGDQLTYWTRYLPGNATFVNHIFEWTPSYSHAGTHLIVFGVTDGITSVSQSVIITVNNTNRAPVLDKIANRTVDEGTSLTFAVNATDPDGDQLTYWTQYLPGNATFVNHIFEWTPSYFHAGTHLIIFGVTDGITSVSQSVIITVINKNRSPVLNAIADQTVQPSQILTFTVSASDPDGDVITYSASGLPAGATFTGGTFIWTPSEAQVGVYSITFTASDGSLSTSQTVKITVRTT